MAEYKEVKFHKCVKDEIVVNKWAGTYKKFTVSIIWSSDHRAFIFYVKKGRFDFNSMRVGKMFNTKEEAIEAAESFIDSRSK